MEPRRNLFGLSAQAKALLIEKLSSTAAGAIAAYRAPLRPGE